MSSTNILTFATRESTVTAIQWHGGDIAYRYFKTLAPSEVELDSDGTLLLQTDGGVETVPISNYLVWVGDVLHSLTPEELEESYVRVQD